MGGEHRPFLELMRTNRYTPGHGGVAAHSDGGSIYAVAYEKVATQIFLDDIDEGSGALEYLPGTHLRHFLRPDGSPPSSAPPPARGVDGEIEAAHRAGSFVPVALSAGSVVFRVPAVWHAVRPVHRLRRYCTARYYFREQRPVSEDAAAAIGAAVAERTADAEAARGGSEPALVRLLSPDGVAPVRWRGPRL
jgi:hypothetical protein